MDAPHGWKENLKGEILDVIRVWPLGGARAKGAAQKVGIRPSVVRPSS